MHVCTPQYLAGHIFSTPCTSSFAQGSIPLRATQTDRIGAESSLTVGGIDWGCMCRLSMAMAAGLPACVPLTASQSVATRRRHSRGQIPVTSSPVCGTYPQAPYLHFFAIPGTPAACVAVAAPLRMAYHWEDCLLSTLEPRLFWALRAIYKEAIGESPNGHTKKSCLQDCFADHHLFWRARSSRQRCGRHPSLPFRAYA